jgi:ABC-type multidrug transport system fused ATPase/permease subunit
MTQLLFALGMVSGVFTFFVRAKASWDRIGAVLRTPGSEPYAGVPAKGGRWSPRAAAAQDVHGDGRPPRGLAAPARSAVQFDEVSFAYPTSDDRTVIERVSLSCEPGRLTAVIGPTGAGKSTLAALVPRFYDATRGRVLVGGADVRSVDLRTLRNRIALVPQKTVLFTGTIADNLRWGRESATAEELEAAARAASAHEFIAGFPEGYASVLGQGGVNLSGGQKQRVAIARTILKDPRILILDDSTSSVDTETEAAIRAALETLMEGRTTFIIAHRIQSLMKADLILVFDKGRIVERGTHATLLAAGGMYRKIFDLQTRIESELEQEISRA